MLLCLAVVNLGCQSDGGSSWGKSSSDPAKAMIESRRAAWPAETNDFSDSVDLTGYTVMTLIPFDNLTDNSKDDAGTERVEEVEKTLNNRHDDAFTTVRIADAPLGQADKIGATGFVATSPRAEATTTSPAAAGRSSRR